MSDFGLNDAIESGLVKTPQVVVRDDGELNSKYKRHLVSLGATGSSNRSGYSVRAAAAFREHYKPHGTV